MNTNQSNERVTAQPKNPSGWPHRDKECSPLTEKRYPCLHPLLEEEEGTTLTNKMAFSKSKHKSQGNNDDASSSLMTTSATPKPSKRYTAAQLCRRLKSRLNRRATTAIRANRKEIVLLMQKQQSICATPHLGHCPSQVCVRVKNKQANTKPNH